MKSNLVNRKVKESFVRNNIHGQKLILAVSGGPDSQALIKSATHVSKNNTFVAVGVNHGLRAEADSELEVAKSLCDSVGIEFIRVPIVVERVKGSSLMQDARNARYAALRKVANDIGAKYICTGHHANDISETVMIRLLRGEGVGSLAIMPDISGDIFRPMLSVYREEIEHYLNHWKIKYCTDPSNSNEDYLRVWVRKTLIPLMSEKNPKISKRLYDLSRELNVMVNG